MLYKRKIAFSPYEQQKLEKRKFEARKKNRETRLKNKFKDKGRNKGVIQSVVMKNLDKDFEDLFGTKK